MNTPALSSPPSFQSPPKDWWNRHWKWVLPLAFSVLLITGLCFVAGLLHLIKSSDAYQGALTRAQTAPAVIAALGSPVTDGWFFTGNINITGSSGDADLSIPVSGPKGRATVHAVAHRKVGVWHFDHLVVALADGSTRIDLSEPPAN